MAEREEQKQISDALLICFIGPTREARETATTVAAHLIARLALRREMAKEVASLRWFAMAPGLILISWAVAGALILWFVLPG